MSDKLIAFLVAISAGTWIYSKMYRSTGGNTRSSLVVAGGSALLLFLLVMTVLGAIFS